MNNKITSLLVIVTVVGAQFYLHNQLMSQQEREVGALRQQLENVQKSVGLMKTEYASAREAQFRALRDRLDDALKTQHVESFEALRDQVDEIINTGALFEDHTLLAEEAFALAETAKKSGDAKRAAIYYLSAVNHAPSEFRFLKAYADLVLSAPDARPEEIAQLRSVLQLSIYQVPPSRIADLLTLDKTVELHEAELLARQNPAPQPVDWVSRLDKLATAQTIEESWRDSTRIAGLIDGLADIIDSLREEQPASELLHRAETELDLARRVLRATVLTSTLDTVMKTLNASMNQPEKAVSLMQTAETTLGQLWEVDDASLPKELREKINKYTGDIKESVKRVSEAQSKDALEKITTALNTARNLVKTKPDTSGSTGAPFQLIIQGIKDQTEQVLTLSNDVSSVAGRDKVRAALQELQQALAEQQRQQFNAYQKWAIQQTKLAFDAYDGQIHVSAAEARAILEHHKLAKIDQALLAPETGKALNDVIGKLMAKADGATAFAMQKALAETTKQSLKDF